MVVDPHLVHAYWEIGAAHLGRMRKSLGGHCAGARAVLRFHESGRARGAAAAFFDVEIQPAARNWYVPLWSSDKTYRLELGFLAPDGRFLSAARSNEIYVPRSEPSPRCEVRLWSPARRASAYADCRPPQARATPGNERGRRTERRAPAESAHGAALDDSAPEAARPGGRREPIPVGIGSGPARLEGDACAQPGLSGGVRSAPAADLTAECERRFVPGISSG